MKKFLARIRLAIRQRRIDRAIATADRINIDRRQNQRRAPGRDENAKHLVDGHDERVQIRRGQFRRDQVRAA